MKRLPRWMILYQGSSSIPAEQGDRLYKALRIAWKALNEIEADKTAFNMNGHLRADEAMQKIEKLGGRP